jgi:CubicO group peptidase (beta-lactamase class C family)
VIPPIPLRWVGMFLLLFTPACATIQEPEAGDALEDRIARVETGLLTHNVVRGDDARLTIEERLRFYRVPAVSVAVIDRGRIDWARAWGTAEAGRASAADTTTLFQAASISKPVTAAGALQLVEDGVLTLDGDVNQWLDSWRVPESSFTVAQPVTLRRLLSHTAGTTVSGFPGYVAGDPIPMLVQILEGSGPANTEPVEVDTVPGSQFRYSGGGYSIVQLLIEDVTGSSFSAFMEERVLGPAGMTRSTFAQPLPADRADEAATAHGLEGAPIPGRYHIYPEMAAAGLWTTPSDLARFVLEIQRAVTGFEGGAVSPESAHLMLSRREGDPYGLGLWVDGAADSLWFYHGGSNEGFQAWMMGSGAGGRGLVVMTNGVGGFGLAMEIVRSIGREYGWDLFPPNEHDAVPVPIDRLAGLTGTYRSEPDGERESFVIEIRLEGDELRASLPAFGWAGYRLRAESPTRFFFLEGPGTLEFNVNETGADVEVVLTGLGDPLRAVRP